jgi:hypothetical protein
MSEDEKRIRALAYDLGVALPEFLREQHPFVFMRWTRCVERAEAAGVRGDMTLDHLTACDDVLGIRQRYMDVP